MRYALAITSLLLGLHVAWGAPVDFATEIKPLLEKACVQCHGPEKQKGSLRLDTAEALRKGGENGAALVAGKPTESELLRRVALPNSEDEVMPPKGKADHFTPAETDLVKRWIAEGAAWPAGLIAVARKTATQDVGPVPTAQELAARKSLASRGVQVRPLSAGVNWTRVSFRSAAKDLPADAFALLAPLTTAVEMDLAMTNAGDADLAQVAKLKNLLVLNLAGTAVTDAGLAQLTALPKLATLNLFGTKITDAGLPRLQALANLTQLYAAETRLTPAAIGQLRAGRPALRVDAGLAFTELMAKEKPVAAPVAPPKAAPKLAPATPKP